MKAFPVPSRRIVRCAIYTRKSSEEGLEQDFNSLDAQFEACAAYILSQASESWTLLPERYDDGGISGGTLARPALQRLLADVKAGRIDTIVVYKVDRLTRSLLDFSKLVEAFDASSTSFVSVTQSFNTTTSMGRLTLNMLLSFAQFEREVTAERIRDKIAASKARGMWMGGTPPLGYAPDGRSLQIVPGHAAIITRIFERYLALGSVRLLGDELEHDQIRAPVRTTAGGKTFGGRNFQRSQLYSMLRCPTYLGEIHHQGRAYKGLHPAILSQDTWEDVQAMLAQNRTGERRRTSGAAASLLIGKVVDTAGRPLIATHTTKGEVRYGYYVSRDLHLAKTASGVRIPAAELDAAVMEGIRKAFAKPLDLAAIAHLTISSDGISRISAAAADVSSSGAAALRATTKAIVSTVRIGHRRIEFDCNTAAVAHALHAAREPGAPEIVTIACDTRLVRSGCSMRLLAENDPSAASRTNAALLRLVLKAQRWWRMLKTGEWNITFLALKEGVSPGYVTRVLRLAFLAPAAVDALLAGLVRAGVNPTTLMSEDAVDLLWHKHVERYILVSWPPF